MFKKCHFIGIGGSGMSGLARLILNKNISVSGSDLSSSLVTESLSREGAQIYYGHQPNHIQHDMTVIFSTDIKKDNPEYLAAVNLNCPLLHRSELLQKLMENYQSLAIAGTHGKTTTSSLLAWVLESSGQEPFYAIGGTVPQLSAHSKKRNGKHFVAEACESDGTFLNYCPFGAIVTNIDFDHMDFYRTSTALIESFKKFTEKVVSEDHFFWCGDDSHLQKLNLKGFSYGFHEACQLRASNFVQKNWIFSFDISFKDAIYKNVEVALTGKHNALNALAVFGLALSLGIDEKEIRKALVSFEGVLRRCETKGEMHGILFLDDYAHHPTELKATLAAIRQAIGERRLVIAYQPHRYSRAKECVGMYSNVFSEADVVFISEIYASRELPIPGISHEQILNEVQQELKSRCQHIERSQMPFKIADFLQPHDVLVTLGAGDITKLSDEIINVMALKSPPKLKVGIIFGGMSVEHEISLISSANIAKALSQDYYSVEQFGITPYGNWINGPPTRKILESRIEPSQSSKISAETLTSLLNCDILFPVLHGTCGEDGTIQGLFDVFSKAYVGCNHTSSAICMNKVLAKRLVLEANIASLPFVSFTRHDWEKKKNEIVKLINQTFCYPVFVKPVHLGSSIGVHKVSNPDFLNQAISNAFRVDSELLIEMGLENIREIEFSLLGNDEPTVFPPGEIYSEGNVHDYDRKYGLNPKKAAAEFEVIAKLSEEKIAEGMTLAKAAYQTLGCSGMARVDTFLDSEGKFWFNEINPIPGFTQFSLYPLMCAANGIPLNKLIDQLIILGLHRRRHLDRLEVKSHYD